ncbi:transposase [candidate division KSB1 bacterium]|nr:transposase [candidate division KSB1 bacterium]
MIQRHIKQTIILVCDGYFAKRLLLRMCIQLKIPLISRLQSNAALFQAPKAVRKRGRPSLYGMRLPSLSKLAKSKKGFLELTLKLYGKKRQVRVKRVDAIWKPAGQMIQILIVYYNNQKKPAFFFCTDLSLPVKDILSRVAARWSLENILKDLKEHLGWSHWQCRVEKAVSRSATLTCSAASLLTLWSLKQASQRQQELWDPLPWYTHKTSPSMKDMIEQLRARILDTTFYAINHQCKTIAEKERAICTLFRFAA